MDAVVSIYAIVKDVCRCVGGTTFKVDILKRSFQGDITNHKNCQKVLVLSLEVPGMH